MKKFFYIFTIFMLLSIMPLPSLAVNGKTDQDIKVYVNDTRVKFDVAPIFIDGRTMVPIRAVFEAMGADVQWNEYIKTATITKAERRVQIQLDNRNTLVDGRTIQMDVPATGINGRILVPVRFISENLGFKVDWVNSTKTVFINEPSIPVNIGNLQNWGKFASDDVWNYHILQNNILIREHTVSKKQEKIADHIVCDLQLGQEWIYCIGADKGINKIIRLNTENADREVLTDTEVNSFQLVNGWLYYSNSENSTLLYRTKSDGSETMKILQEGDFTPKSWFVQNGFIYYQDLRSRLIYRARIDGSQAVALTNVYGSSNTSAENYLAQNAGVSYHLKLIDNEFLYYVLETGSDENSGYRVPGVYRLPITGGRSELVSDKSSISINMDSEWLYMAVQVLNKSQLLKCKKNGANVQTINEYKENDVPGNIYVSNSIIYYTLLRGSNKQILFRMNPDGQSIAQITWNYGAYPQRIKGVLSSTVKAYEQLKSVSTFQVSKLETGSRTQTQTVDRKSNHTDTIYYQLIKDEKEKTDIEVWTDTKYRYTKSFEEKLWGIEQHNADKSVLQKSMMSYILPTEELYNNLTINEYNNKITLSGTGSFPNLMQSFADSGELIYNNTSDFFEKVTMVIVINADSYMIEEFTLDLNFYPKKAQNNEGKASTSRYSFLNSRFNSTHLYVPASLQQSLSAKYQAEIKTQQALKLLNEGKLQDAVKLLDASISLYSKSYPAYLHKGNALFQLGKYKEAIVTLDRYREHAPEDIEAILLEGWCYLKLGDTVKAGQFAQKALELEKNNTIVLNLIGSIAAAEEDYLAARGFYESAIQLDKAYYEAHLNLASVLFNSGNYSKCIQAADEFLNRFPADRELMYLKAQSLSRQGKNLEAISVYQQILDKNASNDFVTMTYIAIEYETLQNYTKAQEYAYKAGQVYEDYNLLKSLVERLVYDRSTSSSQKLTDFIRRNYLYFKETETVSNAFNTITAKMNGYTTEDVKKLLETIQSPEDKSTFLLSGEAYNAYMNRQNQTLVQTRQEGNMVYFGMKTFSQEVGIKFTEYIQDIEKTEEKTLILDLRDNSGGLSNEANIILDALLPECTPSYIIERNGYITTFRSGKSHTSFKKIGVLVNKNTASSSELLALSLKTYSDNVTIIGNKTMGRGIGQIVYLDRMKQYAIFLVNHYWNVKQENIHEEGLPIDIRVGSDDPDYSKAIAKFLKN
ncbi:MAG: DUF5050 domain-containing protein [Thermoclostridium sp.]|nr:DUF5050 domain-containing protein [Thermoclostridium sp.]